MQQSFQKRIVRYNHSTYLFPMHPFSIPWKYDASRGVKKGCIGNEWVKKLKCLILTKCSSISSITSEQSIIIRFYQPVLFCTKFKSKFYHENIKRGVIQKVHHLQNGIFSGTLFHPRVTLCHFSPTPLPPVSFAKKWYETEEFFVYIVA